MPFITARQFWFGLAGAMAVCLFSSCATVKSAFSRAVGIGHANSATNVGGSSSIGTSLDAANDVRLPAQATAREQTLGAESATASAAISQTSWQNEMQVAAPESSTSVAINALPVSLQNDRLPGTATNEPLPAPSSASSERILGLRDAIQLAVSNNPDVITMRAAGPVSNAGRLAAATYPWNPSVQVEVAPYAHDINGNQLATKNLVSVSQPIELAHQRRYRIRAAEAGWNEQQALIAQSELTASVAAMRAYFDALYRFGLWKVAQDSATLQVQTAQAMERRFLAGLTTPTERTTVHILERQSQRTADLARVDFQNALNSLRSVLNLPINIDLDLGPGLDSYTWRPMTSALGHPDIAGDAAASILASADSIRIAQRPDVYAARLAASQAKANLDLAKANTIPNVSTGPTYERDETGTLFLGVIAQMDVPVWNTGGPAVRQRAAEYQQQLITAEQTRRRAVLQAQAALQRYAVAYHFWQNQRTLKATSVEDIRRVVDAFEHGQASFLEVLSVRDSLLQDRKSQLELLREISQASADVVAALAVDPDCLIEPVADHASPPGA